MAKDPIRPTDDEARQLARDLIAKARFGALATLLDGMPFVTRIALAPESGGFLTLVSDLSTHTKALRTTPKASLLVGEPGPKGDPLTHPRMTLQIAPEFLDKTDQFAAQYLTSQPKAQLYIKFADFHLVRLKPLEAHLNGGFGKAYRLQPNDLIG
jgi:putative heme iron utilization protein